MSRRSTVIAHLKSMGYTIGEDTGSGDVDMVAVGLITDKGSIFMITVKSEELEKDFIIETIVNKINRLIQKEVK
jgi:hypothetical protein